MSDTPITSRATFYVTLANGKEVKACDPEVCRDLERRLTALEAQHRERVDRLMTMLRKEHEAHTNKAKELKPWNSSQSNRFSDYADEVLEIIGCVDTIFGPEPKQTT